VAEWWGVAEIPAHLLHDQKLQHPFPTLDSLQSHKLKAQKRNGDAAAKLKIKIVWLHKLLIGDRPPRSRTVWFPG